MDGGRGTLKVSLAALLMRLRQLQRFVGRPFPVGRPPGHALGRHAPSRSCRTTVTASPALFPICRRSAARIGSLCVPSPRAMNALPALEYPGHFLIKKITTGGTLRFGTRLLYLANAMTDQTIGLEEIDDGQWLIYFNTVLLASCTEHDYIITG